MNKEVASYKDKLDNLFAKIDSLNGFSNNDIELSSHWANYLCILTSGFLEVAVRTTYGNFVQDKSHPFVASYVDVGLKRFQNPKMSKIIDLVNSFNPMWAEELRNKTEGELKDAVDSIVANRNSIAHGQVGNLTYSRAKEYYKKVIRVVELLDELCANEN